MFIEASRGSSGSLWCLCCQGFSRHLAFWYWSALKASATTGGDGTLEHRLYCLLGHLGYHQRPELGQAGSRVLKCDSPFSSLHPS